MNQNDKDANEKDLVVRLIDKGRLLVLPEKVHQAMPPSSPRKVVIFAEADGMVYLRAATSDEMTKALTAYKSNPNARSMLVAFRQALDLCGISPSSNMEGEYSASISEGCLVFSLRRKAA